MKEKKVKIMTKSEDGNLKKVIEYPSGNKVEIPINKDGLIKWFDDTKLFSNTYTIK